jgi:hypothetical protein
LILLPNLQINEIWVRFGLLSNKIYFFLKFGI